MKTIGIIGGISWLSTLEYYRLINQLTNEYLGGVHSAKMLIGSVDYEEIKQLTFANDWNAIQALVTDLAKKLEVAGADCLLLGANTMHKIAAEVQSSLSIPLLHIAAAAGQEIQEQGLKKVALLGTRYTMELGFYQRELEKFDIETVLPPDSEREFVHNAIYEEMGRNIFLPSTKQRLITMIEGLAKEGAQGVILGCTEIPLMIKAGDCSIPVFDTTLLHSQAAVHFALASQPV